MVALIAPNGVEVHVQQEQTEKLLKCGYSLAEAKPTKPNTAQRKKATKPKE